MAVKYDERIEYFLYGVIVGSDPKFLSGVGVITNKILRFEEDDGRVRITTEEETQGDQSCGI